MMKVLTVKQKERKHSNCALCYYRYEGCQSDTPENCNKKEIVREKPLVTWGIDQLW